MLARPDFKNVRVEFALQTLYHIFPSGKPSAIRTTISPNAIIAFIVADDVEIAIFFQLTVAFNVTAFVVNNVYMRSFHLISFLDD
jgi:hypothetical protein